MTKKNSRWIQALHSLKAMKTLLDASTVKRVAQETIVTINERNLLMAASSLAYTTILSIVPLLAVSFSIFKAFGGLEKLYDSFKPLIIANLAESSGEVALQFIDQFVSKAHAGAMGVGGMIGLLVTSLSLLSSVEKAINRIWNATIQRTFFQRISAYWLFITLGPVAMAAALGASSSANLSFTRVLPQGFLGFMMIWGLFFAVYKWVPNRKVNWTPPLIGGLLTSVCWTLAKMGYGLYVTRVVAYNKIYGSLGAVPIILLWIYILWTVILGGAVLAFVLQRRLDLK